MTTPSGPLRVLIVEDDAANCEVLCLVLEMAGHQVFTAGTGEEALRQSDEHRPEVVLLDLNLPDQSGAEVALALRARMTPAPRIIITSGTSLEARDASRMGADAFLQKPYVPDRLLELLEKRREIA